MQHNKQLQKAVEARNKDMATVHECLTSVMAEVNALDRVAQNAAVSAQFGTDKSETVAKMGNMMERMHLLQEVGALISCLHTMRVTESTV